MGFNTIDLESWERKECFNHFMNVAQSSYSLTINMDITQLMRFINEKQYKLYSTFTWIITRAINQHIEFKMSFDSQGNLGYYDEISPCYSVLNEKTKIMDSLFTAYQPEFQVFYKEMGKDLEHYKLHQLKPAPASNFFLVSCLPWLSYTSFNVNNEGSKSFLMPMVTWGKYFKQGDKALMPLTLQVHHAVADGYHCSLFYEAVEQVLQTPEQYLK